MVQNTQVFGCECERKSSSIKQLFKKLDFFYLEAWTQFLELLIDAWHFPIDHLLRPFLNCEYVGLSEVILSLSHSSGLVLLQNTWVAHFMVSPIPNYEFQELFNHQNKFLYLGICCHPSLGICVTMRWTPRTSTTLMTFMSHNGLLCGNIDNSKYVLAYTSRFRTFFRLLKVR